MKKTLIALAVGGAFAAPAAFADVTLSGSINAGPAYRAFRRRQHWRGK